MPTDATLYTKSDGTRRELFTSGQVAMICDVATRTVAKWFDAGKIVGYRLPGSQDRRVHRDDLVTFLRASGMRVPPELAGGRTVAVSVPPEIAASVVIVCPASAGGMAARGDLAAVLVGCGDGLAAAAHLGRVLRGFAPAVRLALLLSEDRGPGDVNPRLFDTVFSAASLVAAVAWATRTESAGVAS